MRTLLLCLLAASLFVLPRTASVAAPNGAVTVLDAMLVHEKRKRTYRLLVPSGHDKSSAVPLVLALHGGGGTATQLHGSTRGQFDREAATRGWIVAFPQGVAKGWNDGRPLVSRRDQQRKGVDDVAFLGALIDHLHTTHGIDRSRVFSTGISNGGFMSFRLGLELSSKIAAIAPVTANLAKVHDGKKPSKPVGLLVINGTKDPLVPYAGGHVKVLGTKRGAIFSTDETMKRWAAFNGCAAKPTTTAMPNKAPLDGARPYRVVWPACTTKARVGLIRIEGGGHTWPGGKRNLPRLIVGALCRDFDAATEIFAFFAKHQRTPEAPKPVAAPDPLLARVDAWLRTTIEARVKQPRASLSGIVVWTRRELTEELFTAMATWSVISPRTPDAARVAWATRGRAGWLEAGYGSGSFIVKPVGPRPPGTDRRRRTELEKEGVRFPKPPTRDAWWAQTLPQDRMLWTLAYVVENSGLFQIDGKPVLSMCATCKGTGFQEATLHDGSKAKYLCTRCGGLGKDATVRFR